MSKAEAAAIFQTGNYTLQHHPPTNDQTVCVYPGSAKGVSLITSVSWSKNAVSNVAADLLLLCTQVRTAPIER